jgi:hypothetical protein
MHQDAAAFTRAGSDTLNQRWVEENKQQYGLTEWICCKA